MPNLQRLLSAALFLLSAFGLSAQNLKPVAQSIDQFYQQHIQFDTYAPFTATGVLDEKAAQFARGAQFLQLDAKKITALLAARPQTLALELPFNGETVTVDLVQFDPLTEDFKVTTNTSAGRPVGYKRALHYQGILRGDFGSLAGFSFFQNGEVMGVVSDGRHGNRVLGLLETPGNRKDYIFYDDSQTATANPFTCYTEEGDKYDEDPHPGGATPEVNGCVRIFFEVDNELFVNKGSMQATVDYVAGCFAQMAILYTNETISTKLNQVFVWVTPDAYSTSSSGTALNQFVAFRTSFDADLAHMVGTGGNNFGGIAYIDVLCSSGAKHAVSDINPTFQNVPTYSWTIMVLTHETGHNLGSNHTHWCGWAGGAIDNCATPEGSCNPGPPPVNGGTVMSYCHQTSNGINFNNGFGPLPGAKIRTEVSTASCLTATCVPPSTCGAPVAITVSNITGTGATIAWTAIGGATSYNLKYRAVGAAAWTTVTGATSPRVLTGLPSNDEIEVVLQSVCGTTSSLYQNGVIFKTSTGGGGSGCNPPAGLTATGTSTTTATASWTAAANATSYKLWYKRATSSNWGSAFIVSGTVFNMTGLSPNVTYDVRVQTVCGSTSSATYATTQFTTPTSNTCSAPTGLTASATTATTASVSWNAGSGATAYKVSWKVSTTSTWGNPVTVTGTSTTLTGLNGSTTYNVRVQKVCGTNTSTFVQTTFTTPGSGGGCSIPGNLTAFPYSPTDADISWTGVANAQYYELQYKASTSASFITISQIPNPPYTLSDLNPGGTYNVRVRANCGSTWSSWTATITFVMPVLAPGQGGSTEISVSKTPADARREDDIFEMPALSSGEIFLAPNPATDFVNVAMKFSKTEKVRVELLEPSGKVVDKQRVTLLEGAVGFDLSGLAPGLYFVRIAPEGGVPQTRRLVKE